MKTIFRFITIIVTVMVFGAIARAQQPTKLPRIGYLVISSFSGSASRAEAFR
jgi:hypothetical protein